MLQHVANSSGPILFFCCEMLIDEIWDILKFLCIAMRNSFSTCVLEIYTKAQVILDLRSMRLSALLYSEFLLTFFSEYLVLLLALEIRLGQCI